MKRTASSDETVSGAFRMREASRSTVISMEVRPVGGATVRRRSPTVMVSRALLR
jgi:hypothetical protein